MRQLREFADSCHLDPSSEADGSEVSWYCADGILRHTGTRANQDFRRTRADMSTEQAPTFGQSSPRKQRTWIVVLLKGYHDSFLTTAPPQAIQ